MKSLCVSRLVPVLPGIQCRRPFRVLEKGPTLQFVFACKLKTLFRIKIESVIDLPGRPAKFGPLNTLCLLSISSVQSFGSFPISIVAQS